MKEKARAGGGKRGQRVEGLRVVLRGGRGLGKEERGSSRGIEGFRVRDSQELRVEWGLEEKAEEGERGKQVGGLSVGLGRWGFEGLEEKKRAWGGERGKRVGGLSVVFRRWRF